MSDTMRLDVAIVQRGLAPSREKAHAYIKAGAVYLNGKEIKKAGHAVAEHDIIQVNTQETYVSRGGYKLEKALAHFSLQLTDLTCLDVGASTGGFTDCMLQHGAKKVYAVDSGKDQLAQRFIADPRVISLEQTNFRYITEKELPEAPAFASVDVSFISLRLILPVLHRFLAQNGGAVCLIKPQFEAGRQDVGKKGVVKNPRVHERVIAEVIDCATQLGFSVSGLTFSPIRGPEGNIEYLLLLHKFTQPIHQALPDIAQTVQLAADSI